MLEKLTDPHYVVVSKPSFDAIAALVEVMKLNPSPNVAEIGVGIGATTCELARRMGGKGELFIFDYADSVDALKSDLEALGFFNIRAFGNSRKTFDGYSWNLAKLLLREGMQSPKFDLVYLDGAHAFHHDAPAIVVLKEMMRPGGLILLDDYSWTFNSSSTLSPKINPLTSQHYTEEQLDTPHIEMICRVFLDTDSRFRRRRVQGGRENRAMYERMSWRYFFRSASRGWSRARRIASQWTSHRQTVPNRETGGIETAATADRAAEKEAGPAG